MKLTFAVLIILIVLEYAAIAQGECEVPINSPVLTSVSVQPESGMTTLNWILSPDPGIAAYIIYTYMEDQGSRGDPVDTLWNTSVTNYSYLNPAFKYFSTSYVVTALRLPDCEGPFSNVLTTIFAEEQLDTCNNKILLSWNGYSSFPKNVTGYTIFMSVNGTASTEAGKTPSGITSFTLANPLAESEYCFYVRADLEDGSSSTSNRVCVMTNMQKPPEWINGDFASVTASDEISLGFTVDPSSEIDLFSLDRKKGQSGVFERLTLIRTAVESVTYTDNTADVKTVNYYRLTAINNCNAESVVSNIAANIVLTASSAGDRIRLEWNKYRDWLGEVKGYRLFMDTGNGFFEEAIIPAQDTIYNISIPEIMYDISGGEVCFFITAEEELNPYGINSVSNSNRTCFDIGEVITVPNLFTPDGDLKNDLFKPVLTFTPSDYHLIISSRQGRIVFETRDFNDAWDGTDKNGPVTDGAYIWILKTRTNEGKRISRTGTVTLIKNR